MASTQETLQFVSPAESLDNYVETEVARLQALQTFFAESLPVVVNLDACNATLEQGGRLDLNITEPATLMPLVDPKEVTSGNLYNFNNRFSMITGEEEVENYGFIDKNPIAINEDQLTGLIDGSFLLSENPSSSTHAVKPAFLRMLMLFPEFTKHLVVSISSEGYKAVNYEKYAGEIFIAYQLMSHLVDKKDEGVIRNGNVNEKYLLF